VIWGFLITLGDCHHLDGLVDCGQLRTVIVRGFGEGFVRGVVLALRETRRTTLVEQGVKSVKWSGQIEC